MADDWGGVVTCIVGIAFDGVVYMGGDSAATAGPSLSVRADRKVFLNGAFLIGFTSSFRMGQLLQYVFSPPVHHAEVDVFRYMVAEFIPSVRKCLSDGGYSKQDNGRDSGGAFLVGYHGRLFQVESDFQVGEAICGFDAVGCGCDLALGSLYSTAGANVLPYSRIDTALAAAAAFSGAVCAPFYQESLARYAG